MFAARPNELAKILAEAEHFANTQSERDMKEEIEKATEDLNPEVARELKKTPKKEELQAK